MSAYSNSTAFGNYLHPFHSKSLWNCKAVDAVLDTQVIKENIYPPFAGPSNLSVAVFEAADSDGPMTIYADPTKGYIRDPDALENKQSITVPRWPSSATPATGGDGHCDVVDSVTGIIHSFWQLKKQSNGQLTAVMYSWTYVTGSGWGDPAHYYQGARAAAVCPSGGLIRKHEVLDTLANYNHALAMSLPFEELAPNPAYCYPATSADAYAASLNKGTFPEGTLFMLPPTFDSSQLADHELRKIANTLKIYGAYVVDQNVGTPFSIYAEIGSAIDLSKGAGQVRNNADLHIIRSALRKVISARFVSQYGVEVFSDSNPNIFTMRGVWSIDPTGVFLPITKKPVYDTWKQALVFPASTTIVEATEGNGTGFTPVSWAKMKSGETMKMSVTSTNGGQLKLVIWSGGTVSRIIPYFGNGESATFTLPVNGWIQLYAKNPGNGLEVSISATVVRA